jgi:hypothetical protein
MRRSFACMLAGLMIVGPLIPFTAPWAWQSQPHPIAVIALAYVWIGGVMLLYEELAEPRL